MNWLASLLKRAWCESILRLNWSSTLHLTLKSHQTSSTKLWSDDNEANDLTGRPRHKLWPPVSHCSLMTQPQMLYWGGFINTFDNRATQTLLVQSESRERADAACPRRALLPWVHLRRRSWLARTGPSRTGRENSGCDGLRCRWWNESGEGFSWNRDETRQGQEALL